MLHAFLHYVKAMFEEGVLTGMGNETGKELADEAPPVDAEKGARGEVRLDDATVLIEGEIGDRGEIIEVHVAGPRFFDDVLRPAELLVLHLELYLVHEKLVEYLLIRPGVGWGVQGSSGDEAFRPCPEVFFLFFCFFAQRNFSRFRSAQDRP
jgi:hypothetical protein